MFLRERRRRRFKLRVEGGGNERVSVPQSNDTRCFFFFLSSSENAEKKEKRKKTGRENGLTPASSVLFFSLRSRCENVCVVCIKT